MPRAEGPREPRRAARQLIPADYRGQVSGSAMVVSAAGGPISLHSGDGFFFAHNCHFGFAKADSRKKQVDEISRKRLRGGSGAPRSGFFPSWTHAQNVA